MSPAVRGIITRRILVNYRVEVGTLDTVLPEPFEGREVGESGKGIGTVSFSRIEKARPRFAPEALGISFESAAHRVSAVREKNGVTENCVYVPRRDVSSRVCAAAGERVLPAELDCADFRAEERNGVCRIRLDCGDEFAGVEVHATDREEVRDDSVFDSLVAASRFFCEGGIEYSPSGDRYEGVELCPRRWEMKPVEVEAASSSYFEGMGAELDSAYRMEDIEHEWRPRSAVAAPMR
jgi:hypothetical protein